MKSAARLTLFCLLTFQFFLFSCANLKTKTDKEFLVINDLNTGNFAAAANRIEKHKENSFYTKKDRVLYFLDKGAVLHYQGNYEESNRLFEAAELAMEDLFTKSISKAALSVFLNDNVLEYSGEIYENLYVNIFKALNYIHLNKPDDAIVEVNRLNDKLILYEDRYSKMVETFNASDTTGIKIEHVPTKFYDDVLGHYLSYLLLRSVNEEDNSRISFDKIRSAWQTYPEIYNHAMPDFLLDTPRFDEPSLNLIVFTGTAPLKKATGGKITTYDSLIHISDLSGYRNNLIIPFPGIKQGYHFKFAFPELNVRPTQVWKIEVKINHSQTETPYLLEDMTAVANQTFQSKKNIIYFKTLIRTLIKGLASEKAKAKLRKEAKVEGNFLFGALVNLSVDAVVDATENPDLRCWQTMPGRCYIAEIPLEPGEYHIEVNYVNKAGINIKSDVFPELKIGNGLNLIESYCLN